MTDNKLYIQFLKSSEDHRLQLIEINGSIFAILHSPLESDGPIHLLCKEWSLVLLAPIKSKVDVTISAINVICLNEVESVEGSVDIEACNHLVKLDDPAALLRYFQLFNQVVSGAHQGTEESFVEAQQKFLLALCLFAEKMEGKSDDLNIPRVLEIWGISKTSEDYA